jgi:hypothetical protein
VEIYGWFRFDTIAHLFGKVSRHHPVKTFISAA